MDMGLFTQIYLLIGIIGIAVTADRFPPPMTIGWAGAVLCLIYIVYHSQRHKPIGGYVLGLVACVVMAVLATIRWQKGK